MLSFCLDDGAALLDGPASVDEPLTAILPDSLSTAESPTRTLDPAEAEATRLYGERTGKAAPRRARLVAGICVAVVVAAIAIGGYWFYGRGSSKQIESIAVMPFVNESGDPNIEYLSDGMTETLINSLSQVPELSVKARSLVFQYKGKQMNPGTLASELGVQAILTGRIIQRGENVTLSVELIDGKTQNTLWGKQYEKQASGLVTLQRELASDVSNRLKSKLSGEDTEKIEKGGTNDNLAYQAYLKGRYYWNKRTVTDLEKAIEQFKAATDRDPDYALAFAGLADCYAIYSDYTGDPTGESLPKAKAFAEKALSLDPTLGAAHATLGSVALSTWDWEEAEKEFKTAIELDPDYPTAYHWYSILLRQRLRLDEASIAVKRAVELDPLSSVIQMNLAEVQAAQGDFSDSVATSLKLIEISPDFAVGYVPLGRAYLALGRPDDAIAALEKAVDLNQRAGYELGELGYAYAKSGRRSEAQQILKELEEKYTRKEAKGMNVAAIYVGFGDKDKAFEWLEKDLRSRNGELGMITWLLTWEPLRADPRYSSLVRRMGLRD